MKVAIPLVVAALAVALGGVLCVRLSLRDGSERSRRQVDRVDGHATVEPLPQSRGHEERVKFTASTRTTRVEQVHEPQQRESMPSYEMPMEEAQASVQSFFYQLPDDSGTWARAARVEVMEIMEKVSVASHAVRELECRSNFCRVEVLQQTAEEAAEFMQRVAGPEVAWEGPIAGFPVPDPSGAVMVELFLGAQGAELRIQ